MSNDTPSVQSPTRTAQLIAAAEELTASAIPVLPVKAQSKTPIPHPDTGSWWTIDDPDDVSGLPGGITMPFARYIHDHKSEQASVGSVKPVNPDTYLLISAGPDGIYGTNDDINNFQER